jgi:hypothetical protein
LFIDAAQVDPGAHRTAEWAAATINAALPADRALDFDDRSAIRAQIITHAVVGGASFLQVGGRWPAAVGPRLARFAEALVRPNGSAPSGVVVCNVDGVVTPFEHMSIAQIGGSRFCGPVAAADPRATRLFVFHHEGKHAERRLLARPIKLTANEREVEADLHGVAMAAMETGSPLATALSDVRAIEFAVKARGGSVELKHWTCWALDRLAPGLDKLVTHRRLSPRDCGRLLDGAWEGLGVPERERLAVEHAFRSAHKLHGKARLGEFLRHAAIDPAARPYAERCLDALARSLDTGFLNAFEAASFAVLDGAAAGHHTICVDGEPVLSGRMSEDAADILGGVLRHGRIDRVAEIVASADVMGVPDGAGVPGFRGPTLTLLRQALRNPATVEALLAAAVRVEEVVGSRVSSWSPYAGWTPMTP